MYVKWGRTLMRAIFSDKQQQLWVALARIRNYFDGKKYGLVDR